MADQLDLETAKLMAEWMRQQTLINMELQKRVQGLEARVSELELRRVR